MKCRNLAFDHRPGHVFLRTSPGDISCRIQSVDRRLAVGVHPVSAGGVSAYDIRFGSLNLDILLTRLPAGFDPFERLAWCHVEVGFFQRLVLLVADSFRAQVARASSFQIFHHGSIHPLRRRQTVFIFVNFAFCVDLLCADALCDRSGRCDRIFAPEGDKAHLKGCHLGSAPNPHRISCAGVKWRIPHFMS